MGNQLLITKQQDKILTAWVEDGRICQFLAEPAEPSGILGNIYVGKVKNIVKNIHSAFVEFQKGQMGYLPLNPASCPIPTDSVAHKQGRVLVGDEIIVQVVKEAVKTKPPTLSGVLELSGKYVVLFVNSPKVCVSKKIKDRKRRSDLQKLLKAHCEGEEFGLLARTNSASASLEEIAKEIESLKKQSRKLTKYGRHKARFSCLYQAPAAYLGSIRDMYADNMGEVVTDSLELFDSVDAFLKENQWEDLVTLSLWDTGSGKMDAVYNLSKNLQKALQPKVWLKSGAYLVIQPTEALVSIDVNTGKAVSKKKEMQKTFFKVNLEAAKEIALQLRLRNLSGMILVDFIDLEGEDANQTLLETFRAELSKDPVPTNLVDITKLGLAEVTRKKIRKPLYEQMGRQKHTEE